MNITLLDTSNLFIRGECGAGKMRLHYLLMPLTQHNTTPVGPKASCHNNKVRGRPTLLHSKNKTQGNDAIDIWHIFEEVLSINDPELLIRRHMGMTLDMSLVLC